MVLPKLPKLAILAFVLGVAGCVEIASGPQEIPVANGQVIVRTPDGYCVDRRSSKRAEGFVVMIPCGDDLVGYGVISVQIGDEGTASVAADASGFLSLVKSADGRRMLSASGDAGSVDILESRVNRNTIELVFSDSADPVLPGTEQTEWRAFLDMQGRLVTIAVRGYATQPLSRFAGATLLRRVIAAQQPQ